MRKGYESKHLGQGSSCAKGRQLRKAQWRKLALGVALMTSCWQLGWMPMTEAADVSGGDTVTSVTGNVSVTGQSVTRSGSGKAVDGHVDGAKGLISNNPSDAGYGSGGYTVTFSDNTVVLSDGANVSKGAIGAQIEIRGYDRPTETYILSGNKITITGNTSVNDGWICGARIMSNDPTNVANNDKAKVKSISVENNTVEINTTSELTGYHLIVGGATGIADTSEAKNNHVNISGGTFSRTNGVIAGASGTDRVNKVSGIKVTATGNQLYGIQ